MSRRSFWLPSLSFLCILAGQNLRASAPVGADLPWRTYEAEAAQTNGTVLGPAYDPYRVETESSGQKCVQLARAGDYLEFRATENANAMVVRYSLPDSPDGAGTKGALTVLVNGKPVHAFALTSQRSWLYGAYPFSNHPSDGKARNFFDEVRAKDLVIAKGDLVRLERSKNGASSTIIDLVDLENIPAPLAAPARALSVLDFGANGKGEVDDTEALKRCVASAAHENRPVWVPAGEYRITGDIVLPANVTIQGAGMWQTTFVGDEQLYSKSDRRVRFKLSGNHIHLADFALLGKLNYRNDDEPNDGIVVAGSADSSISRIWIEHTKVGIWVYNGTRLQIEGCRLRDLLADGVNFCVGTNHSTIENCATRGTGDDCFAIWPAPGDQGFLQQAKPGYNIIRHCTGQLPFLANGGAIYGGADNRIEDCLFTDISAGCGILVSSTFPTADDAHHIDNNFSGTTTVEKCQLLRCGGYDHDWTWRGSLQICLHRKSISGLTIKDVEIDDSFSDAVTVIAPGSAQGQGTLSETKLVNVTAKNPGIGTKFNRGLLIHDHTEGGLTLVGSKLDPIENEAKTFKVVSAP